MCIRDSVRYFEFTGVYKMRKDNDQRIYLNDDDPTVVYLKNVIDDPDIQVGEHTYYHDEKNDPRDFVKNNVLYHFPEFHQDRCV